MRANTLEEKENRREEEEEEKDIHGERDLEHEESALRGTRNWRM